MPPFWPCSTNSSSPVRSSMTAASPEYAPAAIIPEPSSLLAMHDTIPAGCTQLKSTYPPPDLKASPPAKLSQNLCDQPTTGAWCRADTCKQVIVCPRDNVGQTLARRTLQAVGLFRVGDNLGVEAAGAGGVKDADSFVVAAKHARAVSAERHAVRGRHLIHRVVGPVGGAELPADCVPEMQRVRLPHRDSRDPSGHWPVYHELHDASPCMHTRCSLGHCVGARPRKQTISNRDLCTYTGAGFTAHPSSGSKDAR